MFQQKVNILDFPFFADLEAVRCFKPVGEALLLRRSGILSSTLSVHQRLHSLCNYRPRIPRAPCLCRPSHRRLLSDELGANFFWRRFRGPCKRFHQWLLELSTLHHWTWNTTVCSTDDNCRDEGFHWKRLVAQFWKTSCWKRIPVEINQERKNNKRNWASSSLRTNPMYSIATEFS